MRKKQSSFDVREVKSFIDNNFASIQNISHVAKELRIPYERIRKIFPCAIGMPLRDYLHNVRIAEAKRIIETKDPKLYPVAKEVGYGDEVVLIRHWKKIIGMTPKQYKALRSQSIQNR